MRNKAEAPGVSAGSMADIAFLLLIFFLVTTVIETDAGLDRMLPRIDDEKIIVDRYERNILSVFVNAKGELLINNSLTAVTELREITVDFIDNGGTIKGEKGYCDYCAGKHELQSSDNPITAIISLTSNRETSYGDYITVQNELVGAYNQLRNKASMRLFSIKFTDMEKQYANPETSMIVKMELKDRIVKIQELYPFHVIEAEIHSNK